MGNLLASTSLEEGGESTQAATGWKLVANGPLCCKMKTAKLR